MKHGVSWLVLFLATPIGVRNVSADDQYTLVGSRVRIETAGSGAPLVGVIADANTDSFLIQTGSQGTAFRVSRDDVLGLEVSRGIRRHTWQGVGAGVLVWLSIVGLYAAFDTLDESGVGEPLFIGGLVAAGGLVGSQIKTERWDRVPVSRVSFRLSPWRRGIQAEVVLAF
jgi:hypothetical protein